MFAYPTFIVPLFHFTLNYIPVNVSFFHLWCHHILTFHLFKAVLREIGRRESWNSICQSREILRRELAHSILFPEHFKILLGTFDVFTPSRSRKFLFTHQLFTLLSWLLMLEHTKNKTSTFSSSFGRWKPRRLNFLDLMNVSIHVPVFLLASAWGLFSFFLYFYAEKK